MWTTRSLSTGNRPLARPAVAIRCIVERMPHPLTASAGRYRLRDLDQLRGVGHRDELRRFGIDEPGVTAQLRAGRWREFGTAVVLHNGPLTQHQRERVAVINCGPRAVPTSFTAAAAWGLTGWDRADVHVLAPGGTTRPPIRGLVLHRTRDWERADIAVHRGLHRLAPALLIAAASFRSERPGCGLLAAAVQQRLVRPVELRRALDAAPRVRHRRALLLATHDIAQGAAALSEIDFVRLCRRFGLPLPTHQAIRIEPSGRRRYLDVEWRLPDGRIVAAEIDGALHLSSATWVDDQMRQNEVVIGGTLLLRYPTVVVRSAPLMVARQLARVLGVPFRC